MSVGEFDIIRRYFTRRTHDREDVILGIGDDAALLRVRPGCDLAVTTDSLVAGVHFSEHTAPEDIGYRAMAVNLSDMAAMGAEPAWAILAITLPAADEAWLDAFARGFFELAERFSVQLVGGDTTRGPLSVTVALHGWVRSATAMTRAGAGVGNDVFVTGTLGDAAAALNESSAEVPRDEQSWRELRRRLLRPSPRVNEGMALRGVATSAIDVSDGLVADLAHILQASGVGARVEVALLPLSPALRAITTMGNARRFALTGGEDYELCFTAPPTHRSKVQASLAALSCPVTCIGVIEPTPGLHCIAPDGREVQVQEPGYRHF